MILFRRCEEFVDWSHPALFTYLNVGDELLGHLLECTHRQLACRQLFLRIDSSLKVLLRHLSQGVKIKQCTGPDTTLVDLALREHFPGGAFIKPLE